MQIADIKKALTDALYTKLSAVVAPKHAKRTHAENFPPKVLFFLDMHRKMASVRWKLHAFFSPDPWAGLQAMGFRNWFPVEHKTRPMGEDELGRIIHRGFKNPARPPGKLVTFTAEELAKFRASTMEDVEADMTPEAIAEFDMTAPSEHDEQLSSLWSAPPDMREFWAKRPHDNRTL